MNDLELLAEAIFPNVSETIADLEKRYPLRNLSSGQEVTRFAPSPTGFLHTGSLCTALMDYKVALDSKGIFYLRIEDTDQQREISGSDKTVAAQLTEFAIAPTEGYVDDKTEVGQYGPYKQSKRKHIYDVVLKEMVRKGYAYPCFCSTEQLDAVRETQIAQKQRTGYYGEYACCRNLSPLQARLNIQAGQSFILRFKSLGSHTNHFAFHDEVRGDLALSENDLDIIIMKSDGLPTYHFAHLVDDHFMRTTLVIRGEEWLPSLPIHIELYERIGFAKMRYAHLPVIMKIDETGKKRKLSKRKDPESAVSYFLQEGCPKQALILYLYTIANSNFEAWLLAHPTGDPKDFIFSFEHTSSDGALFDLEKIRNISQNYLALKSGAEVTALAYEWAKTYDSKLQELIKRDYAYFVKIMEIEKDKPNPRKDYEKFSEIFEKVKFFYPDYYQQILADGLDFGDYDQNLIHQVVNNFCASSNPALSEEEWFNVCKEQAAALGFAGNKKELKANPDKFHYLIANYMEIVRIIITGRKNSPNLYYCLNILSSSEVQARLNVFK